MQGHMVHGAPHHQHLRGRRAKLGHLQWGLWYTWTMKLMLNLETQFPTAPGKIRASGRLRMLPAEQSLQGLLGKRSCISPVPTTVADEIMSSGKYLGFSSNFCCLCAEDMQEKRAGSSVKTISRCCNVLKQNPKHSKDD